MAAQPVPGVKRIDILDVVRGVAIMGILMANIAPFSQPLISMELSGGADPEFGNWGDALLTALVSGKFRGMLAILFGIGLALQFQSRDRSGGAWPGTYLRRTLLLILLGMFHGLYIWYGDILMVYGITALIMMWFAKASDATLKWVIGLGMACGLFFGGIAVLMALLGGMGGGGDDQIASTVERFPALSLWLSAEGETAVYQTGTYATQLVHRLGLWFFNLFNEVFLLPYFCGLFSVGMLIGRSRVWEDPERLNKWLMWGMIAGFGVGLPLNLATIPFSLNGYGSDAMAVVEVFLSPFLCIGYLSLLAWLGMKLSRIMAPFAAVGKTALSCYLLTSLLATAAYYSWGLGLYGRTTVIQDWIITFSIWAILLVFAGVWTRYFALGPVEWIWRSLSLGRPLSFRRST